jgi:hypothetical protein
VGRTGRYVGPSAKGPYRVREQVDRLMLITRWHHFEPERPVLAQAGETIWIEDDHLMVKRNTGRLDAYPGAMYR